ncbi:MAG: hypothetical protein JWP82_1466, partial [Humibacillus sp.]|nr:hypothetical protein [Humibacillus sp.]
VEWPRVVTVGEVAGAPEVDEHVVGRGASLDGHPDSVPAGPDVNDRPRRAGPPQPTSSVTNVPLTARRRWS